MAKVVNSAREQIMEVASRLFFQQGFRAVGVDTIVAQSGVAKMTLYRHFPSKDDLIVAYLEKSNLQFWEWFEGVMAEHSGQPRQQLYDLFQGLQKMATFPHCYGCTFQHAAAEYPNLNDKVHMAALAHKKAVLAKLTELATGASAHNPAELAEQLLLLMDGVFVAVRMFGVENNHARSVARAATTLIDAACL